MRRRWDYRVIRRNSNCCPNKTVILTKALDPSLLSKSSSGIMAANCVSASSIGEGGFREEWYSFQEENQVPLRDPTVPLAHEPWWRRRR